MNSITRGLGLGLGLCLCLGLGFFGVLGVTAGCDDQAGDPVGASLDEAADELADGDLVDDLPERIEGVARTDRPPSDPRALGAWLRGGGYLNWQSQSQVHRTDEYGGARVFFNPLLVASYTAGAESHALGAAAVRELYKADLVTPKGLALMVKIEATAEEDRGWFWYEVFSFGDDAQPTVAEADAEGCIGCHSGGVDLVLRPESSEGAF